MAIDMLLSEKLRKLRESMGLPQRKVASALDIDTATYCKIENGKYLPNKSLVIQMAQVLSVNSDELVEMWMAEKIVSIVKDDLGVASAAIKRANNALDARNKEKLKDGL